MPGIITLAFGLPFFFIINFTAADRRPHPTPGSSPARPPDRFSIISAPIAGRDTFLHADEGEYIKKGQLLLELGSLEFANLAAKFLEAVANEDYHAVQLDRIEILVERNISSDRVLELGARRLELFYAYYLLYHHEAHEARDDLRTLFLWLYPSSPSIPLRHVLNRMALRRSGHCKK